MKDKYTYSEIVSVGRKLRRYENLLNNLSQFKIAFHSLVEDRGDINDSFNVLEGLILKLLARYRVIYNKMLNTLNS